MTIFKPTEQKLPKYSKLDHVEIPKHLDGQRYIITEIWHDAERNYYYDLNEWPLEVNSRPVFNAHEKTLRRLNDRIWKQDQIWAMRDKAKNRKKT